MLDGKISPYSCCNDSSFKKFAKISGSLKKV